MPPRADTERGHGRVRIRRGRLRKLRLSRGWTQDELAALAGCSRGAVSTWETTGRPPRPDRLQRLARVFDVPVSYLIEAGFSSPLHCLRTSAGLLQKDVARLLKVCTSTYCDVENGRQDVPERWVPILSNTYGVAPSAIRGLPVSVAPNNGGGGAGS
ncbi:helix-turn-helix domain-containing protein [Streptomyces sp. NBC_01136]|uniref:helix-turn-helix domain-containing protein n=1 Tax=Streptomyces sp. NBC_01136 TaxID=2903754 RepID=UPI003866B0A4